MKILLFLISTIFFQTTFSGQTNCFDSCYQNFNKSTLPFPDKNNAILQGLVGCRLPDFNLKSIDGKNFSLKELSGKVIVINFYFASCQPCVTEIPALNKLVDEYKDKNVVFIAFTRDPTSSALNFKEENGFKYNILTNFVDLETKFCMLHGWPTNMVVDKSGTLRQVFSGGEVGEKAKTEAYEKMKPIIDKYLH